ncbi:TetR family transcriptional regulator [Actinomadura sp. 9N407]|uniref:TetR family transcriptional regulator n=1 Tax=Actinomadura sp. 9N407 TaxID=3375154 RepID=UPI0037AB4D3D
MDRTTRPPRRSPKAEERRLDAERSRRLLLDAALEEFAAKGYAGARVQDIADRAGVNKQLISYYFGGKEGLYREIGRQWLAREAELNAPETPLGELWLRYFRDAQADPRGGRLNVWRGLTEDLAEIPDEQREDLSDLRRRQAAGELADDLEPEAVMLLTMAMVTMPAVMPHMIRTVYGLAPDSPEFQHRYATRLRRIAHHLAGGRTTC